MDLISPKLSATELCASTTKIISKSEFYSQVVVVAPSL